MERKRKWSESQADTIKKFWCSDRMADFSQGIERFVPDFDKGIFLEKDYCFVFDIKFPANCFLPEYIL